MYLDVLCLLTFFAVWFTYISCCVLFYDVFHGRVFVVLVTLSHSLEPDVRCTLWCFPHCEASGRNSQFFNVNVNSDPEIDSCVAFRSRFVRWCTAQTPAHRFEPASVLFQTASSGPTESLWFGSASCGIRGNPSFSAVPVVETVENSIKDASSESRADSLPLAARCRRLLLDASICVLTKF